MNRLILIITSCLIALNALIVRAQPVTATLDSVPAVAQKTAHTLTPDTYKGRQIAVGSGGGFTGFSTTYYLLDNGQLFGRRNRDTTFAFIGRQTPATTKRVFATVESRCRIKTTRFNNPGNLYKFVRWQKGLQTYTVTWGASGKTVPVSYSAFYDSFTALIPASSVIK